MLDALAEFFPPEAEWTRPGGGLFIWATLPDFIDTHDLLAKAMREEQVAFVPGAAAYVDGRGGSSMRLNFSGADADSHPRGREADRQGRARADRALRNLRRHGRRRSPRGDEQRETRGRDAERAEQLAEVVRLPERAAQDKRRRATGG